MFKKIWNVQIFFRDLHSVDASMPGKRSVSAKIQKGTIHLKEFFTFTSVEKNCIVPKNFICSLSFCKHKSCWFSARVEPTYPCFSNLKKSGLTSMPSGSYYVSISALAFFHLHNESPCSYTVFNSRSSKLTFENYRSFFVGLRVST